MMMTVMMMMMMTVMMMTVMMLTVMIMTEMIFMIFWILPDLHIYFQPFVHDLAKGNGRTDGRTDPLIQMRGRI